MQPSLCFPNLQETTTHYHIQKFEYLRLQRLFQPPLRSSARIHPPCGPRQQQQQQQRVRSSPQGRAQKQRRNQRRARPKQKKHPARSPPYILPQQQQYQQPPPYSVPQEQQSHPPENPPPYDLLAFEDEHQADPSGAECNESLSRPSGRGSHSTMLNHHACAMSGSPGDSTFDTDIENNINMVLEQIEKSRCWGFPKTQTASLENRHTNYYLCRIQNYWHASFFLGSFCQVSGSVSFVK